MRYTLALLVVLLASNVHAQRALHPFEISFMSWNAPSRPAGDHILRISTSETAFIDYAGNGFESNFRYGDSSNVDAFLADLTNGTDQLVTYNNMSATASFLESTFLNNTGYGDLLPGPDLQIAVIDRIQVYGGFQGRYSVRVWGTAPEPSSAALFILGGFGLHVTRGCRWRRSLRTR